MKIFFRVDASNRMGTGHLVRCLTLAESLCHRGAETHFICRAHPGNMIELLRESAMSVSVLSAPGQTKGAMHADDYDGWLGVSQTDDAEQTIEALQNERPDWLIIDSYGIDQEWEQRLRPYAGRMMVIDDLADRPHDCDVLLDQNFTLEGMRRYDGLVPVACKLLVGPQFALLRPEYSAYRQALHQRNGEVLRVLVFFGGSDRANLTAMALKVLSEPEFAHLEVDVVVGANNQHHSELEQQVRARPLTSLYGQRPHLADLMAQADLAIGAGGATSWERMCLGLPSVVITLSENQREISGLLAEQGLIRLVGHAPDIGASELHESLHDEIETRRFLWRSRMGMDICDGTGCVQVGDVLLKGM